MTENAKFVKTKNRSSDNNSTRSYSSCLAWQGSSNALTTPTAVTLVIFRQHHTSPNLTCYKLHCWSRANALTLW